MAYPDLGVSSRIKNGRSRLVCIKQNPEVGVSWLIQTQVYQAKCRIRYIREDPDLDVSRKIQKQLYHSIFRLGCISPNPEVDVSWQIQTQLYQAKSRSRCIRADPDLTVTRQKQKQVPQSKINLYLLSSVLLPGCGPVGGTDERSELDKVTANANTRWKRGAPSYTRYLTVLLVLAYAHICLIRFCPPSRRCWLGPIYSITL